MELQIQTETQGRALLIDSAGHLFVGRGSEIYCSTDRGHSWKPDCRIPRRGWRPRLARLPLAARALREYVASFRILSDGTRVAVARDGIYRGGPGQPELELSHRIVRGSRPLNLCVDDEDRVLFGEYGDLPEGEPRHVYVSTDRGRSFVVAHSFGPRDIRHVHNLVPDRDLDGFWVLVGDFGDQPGIGFLSRDLSRFDWLQRGAQVFRAVEVLLEPDALVYGTDSELESNFIVRLGKRDGRLERIRPIGGSSLHACRLGQVGLISTCIEPSQINRSRVAELLAATPGGEWTPLAAAPKDAWNATLFQFGTLVLPHSEYAGNLGMYSGQAVARLHGRTRVMQLTE